MADDEWAQAARDAEEADQIVKGMTAEKSAAAAVGAVAEQLDQTKLNAQSNNFAANSGANTTSPGANGGANAAADANAKRADSDDKASAAEQSLLMKMIRKQLLQPPAQVEVLQKDPNSPLYSVKSFEELQLRPELLKGVYNMGFNKPSRIQETALPLLLGQRQNMIAQSQSGTGKTAAFTLCMLSQVDTTRDECQCLCLAPTYELALQIGDVCKQMGMFLTGLRVGLAVRQPQGAAEAPGLVNGRVAQVVIGTPGTVIDWLTRHKAIDARTVRVFVLDEADVLIDTQGHKDQSVRIRRMLLPQCQFLLFSATYSDAVMQFAKVMVPDPTIIRLKRQEETVDNIRQMYVACAGREQKLAALSNIYGTIAIGQCMIFCRTRATAHWLSSEMTRQGHRVAQLTGDLDIAERASVIDRFRSGTERVLITTNVTARGIDIEQVYMVVNFDLPDVDGHADFETYLHRIGRTGRFGRRGLAINMVETQNDVLIIQQLVQHFGKTITRLDAMDLEALEAVAQG